MTCIYNLFQTETFPYMEKLVTSCSQVKINLADLSKCLFLYLNTCSFNVKGLKAAWQFNQISWH